VSVASTVYECVTAVAAASTYPGRKRVLAARSGIWIAIFAITMSFAALTSALMVRQGSGDWKHIELPRIIFLNTAFLLVSSGTFEMARRRVTRGTQSQIRSSLPLLIVTLALGLLFVAGQYLVWRQLAAQGLYLATTSNSSFFYVLTAMHALHLLGGMAALTYLISRIAASHVSFRWTLFEGTTIYWHFMGGLWLYLLVVIAARL
jgi:cytochrome c oxidase subunit III